MESIYKLLLSRAIFVSGIPRSGTSILMKLIATAERTEVAYEPPLSAILDFEVKEGRMSGSAASMLFSAYLSEHYVLDPLQGRGVSVKKDDYSSILNYKEEADYLNRVSFSGGAEAAVQYAAAVEPRLVFKMTRRWDLLTALLESEADLKGVEIKRSLWAVAASIAKKGWLEPRKDQARFLPGERNFASFDTPYHCCDELKKRWPRLSNEQRAAHYVSELSKKREALIKNTRNIVQIRYEDLAIDPSRIKDQIFETFGLADGPFTKSVLGEVLPIDNQRTVDAFRAVLDKRSIEILDKADLSVNNKVCGNSNR